jgi:aspartate ammonia-lyase
MSAALNYAGPDNLVEATQNAGAFAQMSATMKRAAVQISKICNDLRWMSSGPRCGLNEINLPAMQPGSSIMPGKVNPVIPELVNQVCYQVIGYDAVVSMAAEASELELCMAEPIIAYDLLHGMLILKNACITLTSRCIVGIEANREVCRNYVENSIGLVTALVPVIGYEKICRHCQGGIENRRQRLPPGAGKRMADPGKTG